MSEKKTRRTDSFIKSKAAYCKTVIKNSLKNEYRSNDNAAKYISPTGVWFDGYTFPIDGEASIETTIALKSPEDWLLFMENEQLHAALCNLNAKDLEFLFVMFKFGYTQRQIAEQMGISQTAVHKRWKRIAAQVKKFF